MERTIQVFAIVQFIVIGLSHMVQPRAWARFFIMIRERGEAGVFAISFVTLLFGSIVVAFHNVWTGLPIVLTIVGWSQVVKALIYFVFPAFGLRQLQRPTEENANIFIAPGVMFLILAAILGYHVWQTG